VQLLQEFEDYILGIDSDVAQISGRLRVPHYENALDKLIAATALIHDLTVVTRNREDFSKTGVRVLDPFSWRHRTMTRWRQITANFDAGLPDKPIGHLT
jgi:predicted nucleic acid-binding protein